MLGRLSSLCVIFTGVYTKPATSGDALYLQGKCFDDTGTFIGGVHPDTLIDARLEKHLLLDGDILFAAKGNKNVAALYTMDIGRAVASSSFFVIRVKSENRQLVLPDFIAWFLNQPTTQTELKNQAVGTSLPSIGIGTLGCIELPVLPLRTQERIVQVSRLRNQEKKLLSEIASLHDQLLTNRLLNVIQRRS